MHKKFWSLLRQTKSFNEEYKESIKRSWVRKFSGGKLYSLNELYQRNPEAYRRMISELENEVGPQRTENETRMNAQRRKLFALIYAFCKYKNHPCTTEKAKAIACKCCGVKYLNRASEQKLIAAIKRFEDFEEYQKQHNREFADDMLDKIALEFNMETDKSVNN